MSTCPSGIARHADLGERMAELVHRPEQGEAVVELAPVLRVAAHDERAAEPGAAASLEQLAQMRTVADHVRRQVRHHDVPARGERPRPGRASPRCRGWARRSRSRSRRAGARRRPPGAFDSGISSNFGTGDERAQRRSLLAGRARRRSVVFAPPSSLLASHVRVREGRLLLLDPAPAAPRPPPRRSAAPRTRRASSSRWRSPW